MLIYVADDEPALASLLGETLAGAGHEVVTAADGRELLANVAHRMPDLILLDIEMPGLSGWDVRRALLERRVEAPVIAVTAPGGGSAEAAALSALHFAGLVRKPLALDEVLVAVDGALKYGYEL